MFGHKPNQQPVNDSLAREAADSDDNVQKDSSVVM